MAAKRGPFELQPHLIGDLLELCPLRPDDWAAMFAAASDPLIWELHPARDRYKEEVFREYFKGALDCGGAFAVLDRKTGAIIGSTRYCEYQPENSVIEIGWTFLTRPYWGGTYNGEMKRLMLDHAFKFVDRVVFVIGPENLRSRRAVEKIGAVLSGRCQKTNERGIVVESVIYEIERQAYAAGEFAKRVSHAGKSEVPNRHD